MVNAVLALFIIRIVAVLLLLDVTLILLYPQTKGVKPKYSQFISHYGIWNAIITMYTLHLIH